MFHGSTLVWSTGRVPRKVKKVLRTRQGFASFSLTVEARFRWKRNTSISFAAPTTIHYQGHTRHALATSSQKGLRTFIILNASLSSGYISRWLQVKGNRLTTYSLAFVYTREINIDYCLSSCLPKFANFTVRSWKGRDWFWQSNLVSKSRTVSPPLHGSKYRTLNPP